MLNKKINVYKACANSKVQNVYSENVRIYSDPCRSLLIKIVTLTVTFNMIQQGYVYRVLEDP